jgi:hypothetical protein
MNPTVSTPPLDISPCLAVVARQWLESRNLPLNDYGTFLTHLRKGAVQERARLSSMPFYANRAKKAAEKGDDMDYWEGLFLSSINMLIPPKELLAATPSLKTRKSLNGSGDIAPPNESDSMEELFKITAQETGHRMLTVSLQDVADEPLAFDVVVKIDKGLLHGTLEQERFVLLEALVSHLTLVLRAHYRNRDT